TAEEASAGQWVIVPAFSIRVALRRGNRAPLPRPAVPASPENNYQCRSPELKTGAWSAVLGFSPYFRIGRSFSTLDVPTSSKKVLKTALKAFQLALTA
ncbi:MAG: hypothetical protein UC706_05880, partial [Collinsella sp.]|nr:hypothetical protein [Collinsella sp.]